MTGIENQDLSPLEEVFPSSDEQYQIYQVDNDVYYHFNSEEPERDNRFRCYEYSIFLFYKTYSQIQRLNFREIENNLEQGWNSSGSWKLGDWEVIQYNGSGPVPRVHNNRNILREGLERFVQRGMIREFKLRLRYPELP